MPVTASPVSSASPAQSPSGKPDFPESGMINAVEHLHQRIAVRPWLHVIEQIQLRDAVRTEIIEHYPRFCVAVAIEPDSVQRPDRCRDNVPGVTGRGFSFSVATLP